jgi:hypothetical protein
MKAVFSRGETVAQAPAATPASAVTRSIMVGDVRAGIWSVMGMSL